MAGLRRAAGGSPLIVVQAIVHVALLVVVRMSAEPAAVCSGALPAMHAA